MLAPLISCSHSKNAKIIWSLLGINNTNGKYLRHHFNWSRWEQEKYTHRCVIGVEVPLVKMLQHNYIDKKSKQHVKQISVQRTQLLLHVHINIIVVRLLSESIETANKNNRQTSNQLFQRIFKSTPGLWVFSYRSNIFFSYLNTRYFSRLGIFTLRYILGVSTLMMCFHIKFVTDILLGQFEPLK